MSKKYNKEDIESVFKTHFAEQSLIVMEMDRNNNSEYIETALLKIEKNFLSENDIEKWVKSVPRFRDLYIYEKLDLPLRIRLKTIELPIQVIDKNLNEKEILDWIGSQKLSFDIQQSPLFKIFIFNCYDVQYITCTYHHLLFDAISIQRVFAALCTDIEMSYTEWIPKTEKNKIEKKNSTIFHLQNFVPNSINECDDFIYENLDIPNLSYKEIMAKWVDFLFLASGEDEVCIGEVFSIRNSEIEAQNALGYFVQTWPLFFNKKTIISEELDKQRDFILSHNDCSVGFFFQSGLFDHCWVLEPELKSEYKSIFKSKPHYILSIVFKIEPNGCSLDFVWNLNKIAKEAAKEIVKSFSNFINRKEILSISRAKTNQFHPLITLWENSINQNPHKIAVTDSKGNSFTYEEIDRLSDSLASTLNVSIQEPVGIRTTTSVSIIISMLAILKKRGIYVPLDPEISNERLNYILNDADIKTIISDLDSLPNKVMIQPLNNQSINNDFHKEIPNLDDICYLIYTSGTTGNPKGCAVTNSNLSNLFLGSLSDFNFTNNDRWILAHSYGFDFSTWEIWGALLNGASLYIPDRKEVKDSFKFYDLLLKEKISILNQTPKSFENLILVGESNSKLKDLRYLIFGGDKLNIKKIENWISDNQYVTPVNMYGITETTVHVTFKKLSNDIYSNIGNPLPGYGLSIRNKKQEKIPNGFIGEMYIEGNGVCKGYFNNNTLTSEKFYFEKINTYKSGDLGWRMLNDFYYLGRNDRQIKIRGYRIELGEIEFLLQKQFGYIFRVLFIDNKILVAFHTCSFDIERNDCKDLLPDYANPTIFIRIDKIPLNINGKTDEKTLDFLYRKGQKIEFEKESLILPYIKNILGDTISTNKSFVENGGDSISAIRLVNALKKDNLNISVEDLFTESTINSLSIQSLDNKTIKSDWSSEPDIELYNKKNKEKIIGIFPLSEAQNGILFDSLQGSKNTYFVQLTYTIGSDVSLENLEMAYKQVMNALPALHLQIKKNEGDFVWVLPLNPVFEIKKTKETENFEELLIEDFQTPFDFDKNLIRLTIIENSDGNKKLIWTHHHLLMDGWSLGIFSGLLFDALRGNQIKKQTAYLDFLYSIKNKKNSNKKYWESRLRNFGNTSLLPQLSIGDKSTDYEEIFFKLDSINLWNKTSEKGLTQHNFILSAWLAFISNIFKKQELCLGNVISLREENLENEVGMLIQTLPFYIKTEKNECFIDFAQRIKNQLLLDNKHKEFSYNTLENIKLNLDHIFVFENYPIDTSLSENSAIKIGTFNEKTNAKWTFICYPTPNGINIRTLIQKKYYNTDYCKEILNRFSEFIHKLEWDTLIGNEIKSITKAPILNGKVKNIDTCDILFDQFNFKKNHLLISNNLIYEREELLADVEKLTRKLIQLGFEKNEAVGIELQTIKHFSIAVLAVWKLEGIPCSVDFNYPEKRKEFIWKNTSCRFLIKEDNNDIYIDLKSNPIQKHDKNASFILHTSGSTGTPKGVIQSKSCLANLADWTANELDLDENEKILALSSFGFDASYHELILWLTLGATLVEIPYDQRQDIREIKNYIIKFKITLAWIPARLLNSILDSDPNYFDECFSLKQVVTTGEALIIGDALESLIKRRNIRLFNFYGPTETHVVTAKVVDKSNSIRIPDIGQPINNASIKLLDNEFKEVPKGLIGEIWISGPYLALGYLNDLELTNQKFINIEGRRWYKSGDSGWINKEGNIEYLGRLDDQIKIRGFRIEPYEVESLLHSISGIDQAAIIIDKTIETKLIAFINGVEMTDIEFKKACSEIMPDFMIPEIKINLNQLPYNINGKIDRKKLLEIYQSKNEIIPKSFLETRASKCWEEVLGHKKFSNASFFTSVGGNSIKIMKMQAWIEKNYGIAVSVKELIENQKIKELDQLLNDKENENFITLSDKFPLNNLQNDILIAEKGNYLNNNSPFLISISCQLQFEFNLERFNKALEHIIKIYPHLFFTISFDDNGKYFWSKINFNVTDIQKPLNQESITNNEPLLRFLYNENKITVQWHHILLDAVGIGIVLQEFYKSLSSNFDYTPRNYKSFLSQKEIRNIAKIDSSSKQAIIIDYKLKKNKKDQFEILLEETNLSIKDAFLLIAHSVFGRDSIIAFTDNGYQCGIPGMFTFLNNCELIKDSILVESLIKNIESKKTASMVVNLMYPPELPNEKIIIESSNVKQCKYPYELQIEIHEDEVKLELIAEEDNIMANDIAKHIFSNLEKSIDDQSFEKIFIEKNKEIHFDDFDF